VGRETAMPDTGHRYQEQAEVDSDRTQLIHDGKKPTEAAPMVLSGPIGPLSGTSCCIINLRVRPLAIRLKRRKPGRACLSACNECVWATHSHHAVISAFVPSKLPMMPLLRCSPMVLMFAD
jgi:hypothetical protein